MSLSLAYGYSTTCYSHVFLYIDVYCDAVLACLLAHGKCERVVAVTLGVYPIVFGCLMLSLLCMLYGVPVRGVAQGYLLCSFGCHGC